ncbi:MAG: PEGA domain-containing protein [Myxococcales bacterium]|nr:PEGA domain-containing protein [Myxococcales bacterium]MCB9541425.1 PEGA domain-containing protein [Myxococcales bacterium]MCB9552060.1 PEGA domain-containing protein [Myxococcales bacterium]
MLKRSILALFLLLVAGPPPVMAQSARDQAKAFFVQGREHYAAGRFSAALDAFQKANTLAPHPLMVFNIAQVFEAMEDLPAAIDTYQKYLATEPADAEAVRKKVGDLDALLASWPQIRLSTVPPGAEVRVGALANPPRGRTPLTLKLPPRPQTVYFSLAGHETSERPIKLDGDAPPMTVALVPILPMLTVQSTPPGGKVIIDGEAVGTAPLTRPLPAGPHTIRIELDGFDPAERQVTLAAEHTRERPYLLPIELSKATPRGELMLTVSPVGAEIRVDDKLVGRAPLTVPLQLEAGMHRIDVRAQGADPYSEMVTITEGETVQTEIDLAGGVPWRTVGVIGMGVGGALLAGGAVTGALALGANGDLDDCRADPSCARTTREVALADDVRSRALITDVLVWSGVAIAAGSAVLWLLTPDGAAVDEAEIREQSWFVAPLEGGAAAVGRFEF